MKTGSRRYFLPDPDRYRDLKKKYTKIIHRNKLSKTRRSVIDHYYDLPLNEKTILLAGLGRNINGNLKYILDVLNHSDRFSGYRVFVRTTAEQTDAAVNDRIREYGWSRTETVPSGYDKMMETCSFLLTESWFPYQYIRRDGQTLINIWHGTPLKRLGAPIKGDKCHVNAQIQKNFLSADYLLYPNDFTRDVMLRSYQISELIPAKALMMGYPRTAGILRLTDEEKASIRSELAPAGEKIFAYMPTFREYLDDDGFIDMIRPMLEYLDSNMTDGEVLYVNLHHYRHRNNCLDIESFRHIRKIPPSIETYQVLSVTDTLISDYSSIFFDYLITGGRVILYVPDLDEYDSHQGLNLDIRRLPLALAESREELLEKMREQPQEEPVQSEEVREQPQEEQPQSVGTAETAETGPAAGEKYDLTEFYRYDDKDNPEKLCQLFEGDESGLALVPPFAEGRPKVLLYSDGFISDRETEIIKELASCPDGDLDIYAGCDEKITGEHMDKAYPWLHDVKVLASLSAQPLSSVGAPVKELYMSGRISFRKAMDFLKYEYALSYRRMYGNAVIDSVCVIDSCDPETIIGLSLSPAEHFMLGVSSEAVKEMKQGNAFLKDAVKFAAGYADNVLVFSQNDLSYVRRLLPLFRRSRLKSVTSADELEQNLESVLR